jgi:phosphoribosyl-dephospho-CoA transferase
MGDELVARIILPHSLSPAFSLPDVFLVNQNLATYALYLRRQTDPLIWATMNLYDAIKEHALLNKVARDNYIVRV